MNTEAPSDARPASDPTVACRCQSLGLACPQWHQSLHHCGVQEDFEQRETLFELEHRIRIGQK